VRPKVYHAQQQNFPVWSLLAGSGELRCNACTLCQCVCVYVTYWCGQRIGSAKIKGQHAAALHLIHRGAHRAISAAVFLFFDCCIRMCAASGNRNYCIDTHSLMHCMRSCSSLAVQTHKYTNMQTHCRQLVAFALALLRRCKTNFWEFSNCIYVLWSSFFLLWSAVADTQSNKESVYSYNSFV
jgi:hypothetical protein